jgi:hypothetical integral membrane protein (TIGR02206 family)
MVGIVTPVPYLVAVLTVLAGGGALCVAARRSPGRWVVRTGRMISLLLVADAVSYVVSELLARTWSPATDLPLALCDVAVLVAAAACWWRRPLLVELTYFWGLAGTLQAVITPDLSGGFPHLVFFQYLAGHLGIVLAAFYLVVGLRIVPRPGSVRTVFAITLAYTAIVGLVDTLSGANYMFLRRPPGNWTLLRVLGPWPWYLLSAAVVALALLGALNLPFWIARHRHG